MILKTPFITDVYEDEAPVAWGKMNPKPALAILKATGKFVDEVRREDYQVENYATQCRSLGIPVGLYHLILPNDISQQAQLFVDVWNKLGGANVRPILDLEVDKPWLDSHGIGQKAWANQVLAWLVYVEAALHVKPIIYTNLKYWAFLYSEDSTGNLVPPAWAKDYDLWAAWYPDYPDNFSWIPESMTPKGFKRTIMWQYFQNGRSDGFLSNDFSIASSDFLSEITEVVTKVPDRIFLSFPKSQEDLFVTPVNSMNIYPLMSALEAAQRNGWDGAMNCGAGFSYIDAYQASLKTDGFESVMIGDREVFYANRLVSAGKIMSGLDNSYKAPWVIYGEDKDNYFFGITYGREGTEGFTKAQAAQAALDSGMVDAYLFDSGRSSQICNDGQMIYWPYGPSEVVPQFVGWKKKVIGGVTVKGTAKVATNVKNQATGELLDTLAVGESVYGSLTSTRSDLVSVMRIYRADGTIRRELPAPCKVWAANLTLTTEVEPGGVVTPPSPSSSPITVTISGKKSDGTPWSHLIDSEGNVQ